MGRYKFENLLIALLISRQQYCLSIVDGKGEMGRYKFENLLMAFLINRQLYWLSIVDGKNKMGSRGCQMNAGDKIGW